MLFIGYDTKEKHRAAFPPTCIYHQVTQMQRVPRFFASLRMTRGWECKYVTLGSFLRKELGEALRIGPKISKDLTPLSSVACGATRCPGFKVFA